MKYFKETDVPCGWFSNNGHYWQSTKYLVKPINGCTSIYLNIAGGFVSASLDSGARTTINCVSAYVKSRGFEEAKEMAEKCAISLVRLLT